MLRNTYWLHWLVVLGGVLVRPSFGFGQALPSPPPVVWPNSGGTLSVFESSEANIKGQPVAGSATTQGSLSGDVTAILPSANVTFGPYNISLRNTGVAPLNCCSVSHTFTVTVWASAPGQVAGSSPLTFTQLGQNTKTLTAGIGATSSSTLSVSVVLPSVFNDIKVVAEFSPGAFGRPDFTQFPKIITYPSATCGNVTPGLTSPAAGCMQGAVSPTGILVPDLMPLTIVYEPPGNCSWSNLSFTTSVGSSLAITQSNTNATNTLWNYSAAGGIFESSSATVQAATNANTAQSTFTATTTEAFGTDFGLPLQAPGNPSCNARIPVGDRSSTNGPGLGDQLVFAVQPTFLYWDTAGMTSFRLSTQEAPGTQETIGSAFIRQIDPARPSLRPTFMMNMTADQLQAIRSLDPFAPSTTPTTAPTPRTFEPMACSSGGFLSPSRYIFMGRRCISAGNSNETTQGTTFDSSTQASLINGFQMAQLSTDSASANVGVVLGAFAALVTLGGGGDGFTAADNFDKANSIFDKYVEHDSLVTNVSETVTVNRSLTTSQTSSYAESFMVHDQNREVDMDIYYDSFFGTIAFNPIASCIAPRVGKSCAHAPATVYTPGDFNGDGNTDLIITNSTGSYWYFSNGDGSWTVPYIRPDLPLGVASYVPGDFNGDGNTDLIITTPSGSYWYFSNGDGSWTAPYIRSDWPLGSVSYVTGDFNNDGNTDFVATTWSGSYWYFSNGDGSWTNPYTRTDLPTGVASYVPGDFNGDGNTDLIITTPSGSFWYYSNGDGSWTAPYARFDLPLGVPTFTTADFNNDQKTDMIITTNAGSSWMFSTGTGTWSTPYTRSDLTTGVTTYTAGDFNNDGSSDLVIATPGGSYWYFSNGDGTWTNPYWRADLPVGTAQYVAADFNDDHRTDLLITDFSGSFWYFSNGDGSWTTPYIRTDLRL